MAACTRLYSGLRSTWAVRRDGYLHVNRRRTLTPAAFDEFGEVPRMITLGLLLEALCRELVVQQGKQVQVPFRLWRWLALTALGFPIGDRFCALHRGDCPPKTHHKIERQTVRVHDDLPLRPHLDRT
ncbi:hypothetical protein [Mesorhizobium sp. M0207]|uniref:hypothetical protein n=1 Tax=Mesorhizobium sp. M0207 TaxID=2956915 RepID=UPI00333A2FFB